ncbi:MAG: hypothetical protein ACPGQS_15175, partial [Bradymonadia bacterium]
MKCPSCSAVIDESYVASFGSATSVSCPACGFMMETGSHDLFSTATEFKPVSGWTIRLAKGQEVHFESEEAFGQWLKQTTVTPGDMICKDGENWESLGSYLLSRHKVGVRKTQSYEVPPNTLDAPDPEDEFEELDNAIDTLDAADETSRPHEPPPIESAKPLIMQTAVGHEKRTPPPIPGRGTRGYGESDAQGLEEETADETISISAIIDGDAPSEEGDSHPAEQDAESRLTPEQSLAPPIPETSLAPPISQPVSVPPMPALVTSSTSVEASESSVPRPQEDALLSSQTKGPVASPAREGKTRDTSSPAASKHAPQESERAGGAFVPFLVGAVVGGVLAVVIMKGIAPSTEMSPAQRVVVTKQEAELSLEQKELLKTAERWLSYLALNATTEPQLRSRIQDNQETTTRAKALSSALMMTSHLVDLKRVEQEAERQRLISLYESSYTQNSQGFSRYAGPALKAISTSVAAKPKPDAAVSKPETKTEQTGVADKTVSTLETSRGMPKATVEAKLTEDAAATETTKVKAPTAQKKKGTSSASYKKMLKVGTRHLENGRL